MTKSTDTKQSSYGSLAAIRAGSSNSQLVDILLTNTFPAHITAFSSAPLPTQIFPPPTLIADPVAEVVRKIKPRYHFVAGGGSQTHPQFWEREPFVWSDEEGRVTRFLSLGAFGGPPVTTGKKPRVSSDSYSSLPCSQKACTVVLRLFYRTTEWYSYSHTSTTECYQESIYGLESGTRSKATTTS